MPGDIDSLQIKITSNAQSANDAIDRLVSKLDRLSSSLGRLNTSNLNTLAVGVNRLGTAMQTMSGVKTADFTRLAKNLERLNLIDVSNLSSISTNLNRVATAFNQMGQVSQNAVSIGEVAKNIAKLGNKSVQTAITNIPQLANAMRDLMKTLSTAPNVSKNIIDMTNALANLASQGSRVSTASRGVSKGITNTGTAMTKARKSSTSLAAAFGKFYATYFLLIRGAKQFVAAIKGTADYIEAYNYYNVALGKIASEWNQDWEKYGYANAEAYADSFTDRLNKSLSKLSGLQIDESQQLLTETGLKNLGLNIQEITQYASQLASITNSIGQTGEVSLAASSAFTKLAGDMSSLFNVDYSSVFGNLQSALIGQSRAVYKYGIDITNATLQTYAYNLGLEKAVSEMTQAEKMQLRMIAILDQSRVSWGDLANTINSPSNMMRQFSNNVQEAGMVLGQLFIPILQKVLPVINGVVIAIKRLLVSIAQLLGVKLDLDSFGQGYTDVTDGFDDMADSLDGVADSAKKAKAGLRAFDELKVINMPDTGSGGGGAGGGAGIDLSEEILKYTDEYEKKWQEAYDRMTSAAQGFADRVTKALEPVKKIFEDFAVGDFFQAGKDTSNLVASIFNFFAEAIDKVDWYGIGQRIGDFLAGIDWVSVLQSVGNLIWEALKAAIELWSGAFDAAPVETGIITAILALKFTGIGSVIWTAISQAIIGAIGAGGGTGIASAIFSSIGSAIAGITAPILAATAAIAAFVAGLAVTFAKSEEVRDGFFSATSAIRDGLQPAIEFVTKKIIPDLRAGWQRLLEILQPLGDFLQNAFVSIWQDMINPALLYIGENVLPAVTDAFENLWDNVLVPLGSFLGDVLGPVIKIVSDLLTMLWKNVVVPLANALGSVLGKAFDGLVKIFNTNVVPQLEELISVFQFLWNEVLEPIVSFLWDTLKPVFQQVFNDIKNIIDDLARAFGGLIDFIVGVFTGDWAQAWSGVKDIFGGIWDSLASMLNMPINAAIALFEGLANAVIDAFNFIKSKLNTLNFTLPDWIPEIGGKSFGLNFQMSEHIKIPRLEMGGFLPNSYSIFMAGENHIPEMLGTVGGKTAVAGGAEITGIRDAVWNAHKEEMELMRQQNELLRGILEKKFGITEQEIGKAAANYSRDYLGRTGRPAYSF